MNSAFSMMAARAELYDADPDFAATTQYLRLHGVDATTLLHSVGGYGVLSIADCGGGRFDWDEQTGLPTFPAFVCEAYDEDGETAIDLVAWPLVNPHHVLTMFGRCGLLGAWEAANPATYIFDTPLVMHRTPLDWFKSGCSGAAVVVPRLAARMFLDIPGRIAAQDGRHGRDLQALMESVVPRNRIVVPYQGRRAAA